MSSQELPSSPKSPARTYAAKKRGEKPAAKAKRKANSDDDTRDSAEDPAVVKETPQKEEGYGTEPDRESPAKREGSPDLDSEPLNSPAAGKKKTLSLKNKPAFDDEDEVKASQGDKAKDKAPAGEKPKPAAAAKGKEAKGAEKEGSQKEKKDEKEKPAAVAKPAESARPEKRVLALDDESDKKEEKKDDKKEEKKEEKKEDKKADKKHSAKKAAAKRKADDASDKDDGGKAKAAVKEAKDAKDAKDAKEEKKEEKEAKKPAAAKRAKKEDKEEAEVAKPRSPAKAKKAKDGEKADKKEKKEETAKDKKSKDKKDDKDDKKESKRVSEHDGKSAEKEKPAKKAKQTEENASASGSKGSDKKDGKAKKKGRIEVAISGGEGAEKAELESVVTKRLGGVVVDEVKKSCTAVLVLSEKRTFKVLHALALGVPLVKAEWALASLDGERPLPEFSAKSWFRGTAVARPKGGLLANTKVYVERGVKGVPEESLKALLVAAGAELVSWSRDADFSVLNASSKISPEQSKPVAPSFFLDALTAGALPSPSSHRPGTA